MIICGFWGIGKTFCADNFPRVIDFENKVISNTEFFVTTLKTLNCIGYDILVDIRALPYLKQYEADFTTVVPSIDLKDEYLERYRKSKIKKDEIDKRMNLWDETISNVVHDYDISVVTLQSGEYLSNVFLKWSNGFKENYGVSLINRNELLDKLRQVDSVDWEYGTAKDKVFSMINDMKEYHISRKDII
jgi:hypothetical protein